MIHFLGKVWELARPYRKRLLIGVVCGILAGVLEPVMIAVTAFVYGLVFPSANAPSYADKLKWAPEALRELILSAQQSLSGGVASHPVAVVLVVAAIPAVFFFRGLFTYLNIYSLQWTACRAVADLRIRLFEHLTRQPVGFFNQASSGDLMSRVMNDTTALQTLLANNTGVMVKEPVMLVALFGFLIFTQAKVTGISLLILPVCVVPIAIYSRKARQSGRAMQSHLAELGGVMSESFSGIRIVKAYNLEPTVSGRFRVAAGRFVAHYMRIVRSTFIPGPLLEFAGAVGVALVFAYLASQGNSRPTSTDFLVVIGSIFAMYKPIKSLASLHINLEQARATTERVFELLAEHGNLAEPASPKPLQATGAPIQFDHVTLAYGDQPVLRDINLTIHPGQLVALVGPSGSGKTSLTNLLLRFYDPQQGAVRIGGTDLREVHTRELRNQIAVVTQETVLFNDTIASNIEVGRPGAGKKQILAAAQHAYATEFISEKPMGIDTVVGEKGVLLSGGQRQRIAIARAILRNAPILILDEATSALDTESERAVQAALEELMQGRTTICIAHRLSTIQRADQIVVLDAGRVVEIGTHAELLERRGQYSRLHALQFESGGTPPASA